METKPPQEKPWLTKPLLPYPITECPLGIEIHSINFVLLVKGHRIVSYGREKETIS